MGKALTYHNQRTGEDWFKADHYDRNQIDAFSDPEGGSAKRMPTSIPSPFAQIDLVRTAFVNIVNDTRNGHPVKEGLYARPLDFKLASDALDMAELFFNIDNNRREATINIIPWHPERDVQTLLNSDNVGHQELGKVLRLYLQQDAEAYNFNLLNQLYLIEYNHQIIGGTSPSTLFFTTADPIDVHIQMANEDVFFDDKPLHLYDRDERFQLSLYAFRLERKDFGDRFPDLNAYMNKCLAVLQARRLPLYSKIMELSKADVLAELKQDFEQEKVGNAYVEILGTPLFKRVQKKGQRAESDYEIDAPKCANSMAVKPLVLWERQPATRRDGSPMRYYEGKFPNSTRIPHRYDPSVSLAERPLPGINGTVYPHLVIGDFLEDTLIRLVYPVQRERYFDGNIRNAAAERKHFLLPIKPAFFDYFTVKDLMGGKNGKSMFEIEPIANGAKVSLRIPIKSGDVIEFERIYYLGGTAEPDNNKGAMIENQFGLTIFPFVRMPDAVKNPYRVMLVDRDVYDHTRYLDYKLKFFRDSDNTLIDNVKVKQRSHKTLGTPDAASWFYGLENGFDFIQVAHQEAQGLVIPKFPVYTSGNKAFTFAVDFGTTNTHIEYVVDDEPTLIKPFEILEKKEIQIGTLHDPEFAVSDRDLNGTRARAIVDLVFTEFLPEQIGGNNECRFPQRTVLFENPLIDFDKANYALSDFNIGFAYERRSSNNQPITNLKWSNYALDKKASRRVEAFFEELMLLMRAKVLLNGGDLKATRLRWFYPSSMSEPRQKRLAELWERYYAQYFQTPQSNDQKPVAILESIAPYYYYAEEFKMNAGKRPIVSIDIGGGTTDIVIFQDDKPVLQSSVRFAANSIFGDGFSETGARTNGFVQKYAPILRGVLTSNKLEDLGKVCDNVLTKGRSSDVLSFLFSLEDNKQVRDKDLSVALSLRELLKEDPNMRVIFLIFYTAHIYHLAKMMKARGLEKPRFITFSGNGSRVLNLLAHDAILSDFSKLIFEKIYASPYVGYQLSIEKEEQKPKEATCKGGLRITSDGILTYSDLNQIKTVLVGDTAQTLANNVLRYRNIDDALLESVENEVKTFLDFFFDLDDDFSFMSRLEVATERLADYRTILESDILGNIEKGLKLKRQELNNNDNEMLEESLFFYHFVAALNTLAFKIQQTK